VKKVLWWGRFDPDYSRNRIMRQILVAAGWQIVDFTPRASLIGDFEARAKKIPPVDLVWVPCFRQRDLAAAARWARNKGLPLVFDPLISAYDKQVFERAKYLVNSRMANRLLRWEAKLLQSADLVLADTWEHARFFSGTLGVAKNRVAVVPVGAEENLFIPADDLRPADRLPTVLFYGSFLNLQGPEVIVAAARKYVGPPLVWQLVGEGPLLAVCRKLAAGLTNVVFVPWVPYLELVEVIQQADILLGIFGTSEKAGRVIPNKVYQALACGKPLVTRTAPAYPATFAGNDSLGIGWVAAGDPQQLADKIAQLVTERASLVAMGCQARQTYETYFSQASIAAGLISALNLLLQTEG